jgi:hypothetical protein
VIDRRLFIGTLASSVMAAPSTADTQPSEKDG